MSERTSAAYADRFHASMLLSAPMRRMLSLCPRTAMRMYCLPSKPLLPEQSLNSMLCSFSMRRTRPLAALLDEGNFDFVVDAIDSLPQKAALIVACWQRGLKIVSSLGAGAKGDLSCIRLGDLWHSEHCVLGKNLRRLLREWRGKYKLPVVYSIEDARKQAVCPSPEGGKPLIGTVSYYTTTFGCYLASHVIENL